MALAVLSYFNINSRHYRCTLQLFEILFRQHNPLQNSTLQPNPISQ